jgi:hypothetical protein
VGGAPWLKQELNEILADFRPVNYRVSRIEVPPAGTYAGSQLGMWRFTYDNVTVNVTP